MQNRIVITEDIVGLNLTCSGNKYKFIGFYPNILEEHRPRYPSGGFRGEPLVVSMELGDKRYFCPTFSYDKELKEYYIDTGSRGLWRICEEDFNILKYIKNIIRKKELIK